MSDQPYQRQSLPEFIEGRDPSVRLDNSIRNAAVDGRLPFLTVSDYLASPTPQAEMLRAVRNLGRRTAEELDRMIRQAANEQRIERREEVVDPFEVDQAVARVEAVLTGLPLRDALDVADGTRLARVLGTAVGDRDSWAAVEDVEEVVGVIARAAAIGSTTVSEFRKELRLLVSRLLQQRGADWSIHNAALTQIFGEAEGPVWYPPLEVHPDVVWAHALVQRLLQGMTVASACSAEILPTRLKSLIALPPVGRIPVADMLIDPDHWRPKLLRFGNVGVRTVAELWDIAWRRLAAAAYELSPEDRARCAGALKVGVEKLSACDEDRLALSAIDAGQETVARVPVPESVSELIPFLLVRIRDQDATIIGRRFGLDGGAGETLEEIGSDLRVTRERIRQLESRGLRDMRVMSKRVPLAVAVARCVEQNWPTLSNRSSIVMRAGLSDRAKLLPPDLNLALEVIGSTIDEMLDQVASPFEHGWLAPTEDRAVLDRIIDDHKAQADLQRLPCAVGDLGLGAGCTEIADALRLGTPTRVYAGYALDTKLGTRLKRALDAHAILARRSGPVALGDLLLAYRRRVPSDPCSQRDLSIVMSDAPHLFLEISEERWAALGTGGDLPVSSDILSEDEIIGDAQDPEGSLAAAMTAELERAGPSTLGRLTADHRRYLPPGRSGNSVAPTLIMRPEQFIRILPGVYCLPHQVPTREQVLSGDVGFLLDEQQARIFSMARRAGEPWGAFPLWTPEAEYRLCRWASATDAGETMRSLLATATVEAWPVEADEKAYWREQKRLRARYDHLFPPRAQALEGIPALDRVLAALIDLEDAGQTNWMALNRVDGRRVDSHRGAALLATLILLAAVTCADDDAEAAWQLPHAMRTVRVAELRSILTRELHRTGSLEWTSEIGHGLVHSIRASIDRAPKWLDARKFIGQFGADVPGVIVTPTVITEVEVSSEGSKLLAERRLGELLEWLDTQ